ncbi:MAG: hypothetical protein HKN26_10260 [Acidimicrobiales bacterium]|nr:hypothetical protein [Acidimicrobiales bacterium]
MRVLILGEPKSGTTALFQSVVDHLGTPEVRFEPEDLRTEDLAPPTLVVKKLMTSFQFGEADLFDRFDLRLLLVRDPRDRLVSSLLFDISGRNVTVRTAFIDNFVQLLREKEADPRSTPLIKLLDAYFHATRIDLLSAFARSNHRHLQVLHNFADRFQLVRYEDMVRDGMARLGGQFGMPGLAEPVITGDLTRVQRNQTSGDWRHWCGHADLWVLRPMCTNLLDALGYAVDWDLAEQPTIDPATASAYVLDLIERRRLELTGE